MSDFTYNGLPIYKVGMLDFSYLVDCFTNGKRVQTKNLLNESLIEQFKRTRDLNFGVSYEGVVVDFRKYHRT